MRLPAKHLPRPPSHSQHLHPLLQERPSSLLVAHLPHFLAVRGYYVERGECWVCGCGGVGYGMVYGGEWVDGGGCVVLVFVWVGGGEGGEGVVEELIWDMEF